MEKGRSKLRPKPNFLATIISVSLVLFLLGMFAFISLHAGALGDYFKERISVIAELKPKTTEKEIQRLSDEFASIKEIRKETIRHISKAEAAELLSAEFGEDILLTDMPSPLYDVITFNVFSEYLNKEDLELLKTNLKRKFSAINDIYYQESLIETVISNIQKISIFILILSSVVALITLFLIFNAIKLSLYSNRFVIKNMEMVGASRNFIRRPFLLKSMLHGFISGFAAVVLLGLLLYYFVQEQPGITEIINTDYLLYIGTGVLFAGIFITLISTWIVVSSYLRKSVDELF
jgi:cell division transport system permease protein